MRARRTDRTHSSLIAAFRKMGCWVGDTHDLGNGFPDAVVAIPPHWAIALVEIKDGELPPSKRKLTSKEAEFHEECPAMVWVVKDLDDVQTVVRYYRQG